MDYSDNTNTFAAGSLQRFLVTATRVCEVVIEAVDLKSAGERAKAMCERDKRRVLSVEPLPENYVQPPI